MLTPFQTRAMRALAASPFFGELPPECLRWIHRSSVRKGEALFEKDAPSDCLYGLVGGLLKLCSRGPDGREFSLGLVAPGELAGEIGMSDGAPRDINAVALAHTELATLRRRDLEPLMARHPLLRDALARASAAAARRLSRRLEDAALLSIEARVEKALVDLARRLGERVEHGTRIALRQQDLADLLGLSRESVSKVLTSPSMRGRLELGRGSIVLVRA
jgi:CRP/FNR family transcriptional regulator